MLIQTLNKLLKTMVHQFLLNIIIIVIIISSELLNSVNEKEKLLNIQNDEISILKQQLDSLNKKGTTIFNIY